MLKFCVKVFTMSVFAKSLMDLIHVWHDDRFRSKILSSTTPTPVNDLKGKVTDLELLYLIFTVSVFAKPLMDSDFIAYFEIQLWEYILIKSSDWGKYKKRKEGKYRPFLDWEAACIWL